jgi:hypothetical protein
MRSASFIALFILCVAPRVDAATVTAASCGRDQVATAINSARDGDIVVVPAGYCTWTSPLTIDGKSITLQGAGIDATTIIDGTRGDGNNAKEPLLRWNTKNTGGSPAGFSRLTGFTFNGGDFALGKGCCNEGLLEFNGQTTSLRVDHNKFQPSRSANIRFNDVVGVADHNIFDIGNNYSGSTYVFHYAWKGVGYYGDNSWAQPLVFGSSDFMFFEDNDFFSKYGFYYAVDGWAGARTVIRRNTFLNLQTANHGLDTPGRPRSQRAQEYYQNTYSIDGVGGWFSSPTATRGGTGLIWGNEAKAIGGQFVQVFDLQNYRATQAYYWWGQCDGSNGWDMNFSGQGGYRCMDQPGAGQGSYISGDYPSPPHSLNQALEPYYTWANRLNGAVSVPVVAKGNIAANRDYYQENTSFDGSSGVGVGPLASRPSGCTTGVGYWATDQGEWDSTHAGPDGQLYKCVGTNSWSLFYKPYQYPHPLITGGPVGTTPSPQPPANVRIIK